MHAPLGENNVPVGILIMKAQYIEEASKVIPDTHVLINMVSRRVRQLNAGSRPLIDAGVYVGLADVALLEIAQGKIVLSELLVDAA